MASPVASKKRGIRRSIQAKLPSGIPVRVVFVRHHSKKTRWLVILATNLSLTIEDITRIYAIRWTSKSSSNAPNRCFACKRSFKAVPMIANQAYDHCVFPLHAAGVAASAKHRRSFLWGLVLL
ncbi:hypothetical protein ACFOQM_01605 [Paenibacillus sp. GCM10012307]|uniref:hypothetical protein n=1 Tax=Paenibacillus sp. GCM10012307 TaxID=3317343 RepID=UPI003615C9C2